MDKNENILLCSTKNTNKYKDSRIYYLDYLRIFCSFFVIVIHVSTKYYRRFKLKSYNWKISHYYDSLSRFSVPNFFMISGAVFLNRDISYKKIFNKYIKNIFIHLVLWILIYSLYNINSFSIFNIKNKLLYIIRGNHHLWYLFATIGIYIIVPFLREIVKNEKILKYFIVLYFVSSFIIPNYLYLLSYYSKDISVLIRYLFSAINFNGVPIQIYYFIIGHYLNQKKTTKNIRIVIYITGFIGLIFTTKITYGIAMIKNKKINHYSAFYFNIFFTSITIFIFFKNNCNNLRFNKKYKKIILNISQLTYGIYLRHPLIIVILIQKLHFFYLPINAIYLIPMLTSFIFLLSLFVSMLLKKLPLLCKYLV